MNNDDILLVYYDGEPYINWIDGSRFLDDLEFEDFSFEYPFEGKCYLADLSEYWLNKFKPYMVEYV